MSRQFELVPERPRDQQAVGEHGQRKSARGQRVGEQGRRGAAVDHQCVAGLDQRRRCGADPRALGCVRPPALADAGLLREGVTGAAAVGPVERADLREVVEIAARRLGGDGEQIGQGRDANGALAAKQREDLRVTFLLAELGRGRRDAGIA